jgi:hypothetical protein
MEKPFNNILVPVNFNRNTTMVMEKAVQIANYFSCDIKVLHVQSAKPVQEKLNDLLRVYRPNLNSGLIMEGIMTTGNWYQRMKEVIISSHIDLVVIPRSTKFFGALLYSININRLSQQTQCPVLTVTAKFNVEHLQRILVPVSDSLPIRKLSMAVYLAQKAGGTVHLLGQSGSSKGGPVSYLSHKSNARYLNRAYTLLNEYSRVEVQCSVRDGGHVARGTLDYARELEADLILVNPGRESTFGGLISKWFGKFLYRESNIPVLTIAPPL